MELNRIVNLHDLPDNLQLEYARKISEITHKESKMLSIDEEEVISRRFIALMLDDDGYIISMISIFDPVANSNGLRLGEVGMMYTAPSMRGKGIAHTMYDYAEKWARNEDGYDGLLAFLCKYSIGIFAKAGFTSKDADRIIPKYFFEICKTHCFLNPDAENQTKDPKRLEEIKAGRFLARQEYDYLLSKIKKLGKEGLSQLSIMTDNEKRAGLCCPLPTYKLFSGKKAA